MSDNTTTFRGDGALKASIVADAVLHREQDRLIQGAFLTETEDWKGCAVGCTVAGRMTPDQAGAARDGSVGWHETWAKVTGCPEWLAHVEDAVFEGLPIEEARQWPVRLLSAIPVGVDLSAAREAWLREVVFDPQFGAFASAARALESAGLGAEAARLRGLPVTSDWEAASGAAWAASGAASAASGAAWAASGAAWAARDAAWAARDAASAARGAASAARDAASAATWKWLGDRLIHHLETAGTEAKAANQ